MKSIVPLVCLLLLGASTLCDAACSAYERGVGGGDKGTIVNKHNELRGRVAAGSVPGQPRARNMKQMKYDDGLARAAQQVADTCVFQHKKIPDGRWQAVGQNLYMSMSTGYGKGADWSSAIQVWFDEYKDYRYGGPVTSKNGHYTQLVWANSEYIGCGYTYFEANDRFKYKKLYVCNYGPAGNYAGQNPYQT